MPGLMNESVRDLRRFVHHPLGKLLANSYNQCTASVAQHPVGVMSCVYGGETVQAQSTGLHQ